MKAPRRMVATGLSFGRRIRNSHAWLVEPGLSFGNPKELLSHRANTTRTASRCALPSASRHVPSFSLKPTPLHLWLSQPAGEVVTTMLSLKSRMSQVEVTQGVDDIQT